MKIVHVHEHYMDGYGYQENLLPACQAELGHQVTILTSINIFPTFYNRPEKILDNYFDGSVHVRRLYLKPGRLIYRFDGIGRILAEEKPDLLFVHGFHLLKVKQLLEYKKINPKCRLVVDTHLEYRHVGYYDKKNTFKILKRYIRNFVERIFIKKWLDSIDKVFYVAPVCFQFAKEILHIPDNFLYPLYMGIDYRLLRESDRDVIRNKIRADYKIKSDDLVFIAVGKFDRHKPLDQIINAFSRVESDNSYLFIIGKIEEDISEAVNVAIRQVKNVYMIGWLNSDKILDYFFASDMAVFNGGQSVLWQQALCSGLPAIYKYWYGVEYLDGGNAFFLYSQETRELEQLMELIVENPKKLKSMKEAALKHGREHFDYMEIARKSLE